MKRFVAVLAGITAVFVVSAVLYANVNGAIFTSVVDGSTVNGNIYDNKSDVYLNGGPQNEHGSLLSPDGLYYFQVTDPSGAVLLSTDPVECRVVVVANGRIAGTQAAENCVAHAVGAFNAANGTTPAQLMPYLDTPNNGGEYKAWITPVDSYGSECKATQGAFGFCDSESKTDNFKVRASAPNAAQISVCKFNDYNGNGAQDAGEPFIAHWPVNASGVDGGDVAAQTDDRGCVSFTVSTFADANASQVVTISEGTFGPDWVQTAPLACNLAGCVVDGGVVSLTVRPGDAISAPNFGNHNPYCLDGCTPGAVIATANAYPSYTRTFAWTIAKSAEQSRITSSASQATAQYTVSVSHDAGTDSEWRLAGSIRVANPGAASMTGLNLTAQADGGVCVVTDGTGAEVLAGSHRDFAYHCEFASAPSTGTVAIAGTYTGGQVDASAGFNFASAVVNDVDENVTVTDSMAGQLGTIAMTSPSPTLFSYARTLNGVAGTCTSTNNTAAFTTNDTGATGSASKSVQLCVGANLSVSETAVTSFTSAISKSVDRTVVEQQAGSVTFNYSIGVTESAWTVSGVITLVNPNDWEDVTVNATQVVPGATCTVSGSPVSVPAASSVALSYSCVYAGAPVASSTASVTASWDAAAAFTQAASAVATAPVTFEALTVVDAFNGGAATTLGTIASPAALTTYAYSKTVPNAAAGTCQAVTNVATITGRNQSASQTAYACNTITGARTIGFWQNKNGQAILTGAAATAGVCNATTWLRGFLPFQDLAATASCKTMAAYVTNIIKVASASGASMNAMLKAQMLASALNVYFSDAALGGNGLGAPTSVGGVKIDVSKWSGAFNGATKLTVMQMLQFQNGVSNAGGSIWYANVKTVQEFAKNAFDAINNEIAPIAH